MALSKASYYGVDDQLTSKYARALIHPERLCIIRRLRQKGPCTVSALKKGSPLSQPSLSQHLSILMALGLVELNEVYPHSYYKLHDKNLEKAKKHIKAFLDKI